MLACTGPIELVTAPLGRVVSVAEAKTHYRVEVSDDDGYIGDLIDSAQEYSQDLVEGARQWLPACYDLPLAEFPLDLMILPRPPLLAVKSISYYDTSGTSQTLSTSIYNVRTPWRAPGSIERAPLQIWPTVYFDKPYPITIRFWCGYGASITAATSDVITLTGRRVENNQVVRFVSTTTLPAGLDAYTDYYVISASNATFKVSTTLGGSAVDITDTGTGSHFVTYPPKPVKQAVLMLVAHAYRNREPLLIGSISKELEFAVTSLLHSTQAWGSYA